ncbi:DEAD/DEAH box helicase [Methanolobus sp. ZRKC3]|uniref:DEAD/DEAH box helicase n=1 Tax=Methanolobus sp. ZRKC3 TaxID=3125786 RepID=UPI003249F7FE
MTFKNLHLISPLLEALAKEGYSSPTPIQSQAIPHLLEGRDLMGIAQTGTGKTAAFVLPMLQQMVEVPKTPSPGAPRMLVLAPTRELAAQIDQSVEAYGKFLKFRHTVIFGGVSQAHQVRALSRRVDILVATPGRLLDLMDQGFIRLDDIDFFVLDEADRMLDMGFIHDVRRVVSELPVKRQSLFFSATMSPQIGKLAKNLLTDPLHVEVTPQATTVERIDQEVFFVDQEHKNDLLVKLLRKQDFTCVLVFTRTKHRANKVALMLNNNKIHADAIHGNKSQNQRTKALKDFKSGFLDVLVATDIAARGIDVEEISHVINYDLPNESESYVHRIGRTARAGSEGTAYSFCAAEDRDYLRNIEKLIKMKLSVRKHEHHSNTAQFAEGAAARPVPRVQGKGRGKSGSSGGRNQKSGQSSSSKGGNQRSGQSSSSKGGNQRSGQSSSSKGGNQRSGQSSSSKGGNQRSGQSSSSKGGSHKTGRQNHSSKRT